MARVDSRSAHESGLGPLLFNIYLNDLFYLVESTNDVILQAIQLFMHAIKI